MHKLLWHQSSDYTRKMYGCILDMKVRGNTEPKVLEEPGAFTVGRNEVVLTNCLLLESWGKDN